MPSIDRDQSRESERRLKHQHSASSDHGRALVPMWDSSDPERAPPPLPLNPQSSPSLASRPNTSSVIQAHHAALTEKARENSYTTNLTSPERKRNDTSPDRSLMKAAAHKRMQSLQTGHVKDLSAYLENGVSSPIKSPEKNQTRPSTPYTSKEFLLEGKSSEKENERSSSPTPVSRAGSETPTLRPSLRRPQPNILGENSSPQSATMVALQSMASTHAQNVLGDVTNGSTAIVRAPQNIEGISTQILSLTNIATSLQREMAALSRRSKDNATDLVSLKAATNARDEDIRKSLRELVSNLNESTFRSSSTFSGSPYLIDNVPHTPNSRSVKTVSLPRIPSPNSFTASLDRDTTASPTPYNIDGTASIALLEKVLREMGTKEGQDLLVSRLSAVADRLSQDGVATAKKLEDLVQYIKDNTANNRALVAHSRGSGSTNNLNNQDFSFDGLSRKELDFDGSKTGPMVARVENLLNTNKENRTASASLRAAEIVNEDIVKIVRSVKDSVAQGGGLTAEVKALVRELRGEVLGMGREIGRKLDESISKSANTDTVREQENVARVVHDGLEELKEHMERILRENRRRSMESVVSKTTVDGQEVYSAVKAALVDHHRTTTHDAHMDKEDIIEAVREAWESYKPDIEVQHFGLEREELLACLKEGIQQYTPPDRELEVGATRDEVFTAVVEGLKHFNMPKVETPAALSREEILDAVRECLEEFEFPAAPSAVSNVPDISRDDMLDAVKEGLNSFEFPNNAIAVSKEISEGLTRDDVLDAVKSGIAGHSDSLSDNGLVSERLQEIIDMIQQEFKAVSDEAKQNVAAHGRDTEQLLDAHKDGMEKLRSDIEGYVDRAADLDVKEEILDSMRDSFGVLQAEIVAIMTKGSECSVDAIKDELDNIRESMSKSLVPSHATDREEIITALREGLDSIRADIERPRDSGESILSGTGEILDALHDGLNSLRAEVEKISTRPVEPVDMTVNYEILDTLRSGLEGVRADIDRLRDSGHGDREVAAIGSGAVIASDGPVAESLKRNDIENLEVLITQLRIKVEALEAMQTPAPQMSPDALSRADLEPVQEAIRNVQASVAEFASSGSARTADEESIRKEDVEAIETLLRNTKAKIDEMDPEQAVRKEHLDVVELVIREARDGISDLLLQMGETTRREDISALENLVKEVLAGLEDIKERASKDHEDVERVAKTGVEAVEVVCNNLKAQIEQVVQTDLAGVASKDDVNNLEELIKEFKERNEAHAENSSKAFEERQAETVGVGERVSEVKSFLEDFKDAVKEKLEEGATGVEALGQVISGLEAKLDESAAGAKELLETLASEFEKSNAGVVGVKLESDERFEKTWTKFDEKFNELMTKYDDAQHAADAKASLGEENHAATEEALNGTKVVAEELKLLIDTLGTTLTESVDKMDEASKTVFTRVDDTFARVEETHADAKAEHQLTREQIFKAITAVDGIGGTIADYHPKILESIKEVLQIVGQHYEHSKTTADVIDQHYEHSKATADTLQEKIEARPVSSDGKEPPLLEDSPIVEKYDDTQVHEKLDKLVDHMHSVGKSSAQLDMLDKIHAQVMDTAAEVSSFVSNQTQRIANDHEDKEKAVEAATIALEKRLAQKEVVEAEVIHLRDEEQRLRESVLGLKADQENLAHQKLRLSAEVSSLETALRIRREEIYAMEARAEGLERRILEGVIDHSRAFLINKNSMGKAGRDAMNLKRVPSHAASTTGSTVSATSRKSGLSNTNQNAVTMAMGGNRAALAPPINSSAGGSRRILSLNQITSNIPNGGFKRSHSVKAPGGGGVLRKSSWGGNLGAGRRSYGYGELNKENLALKESEDEDGHSYSEDEVSDAGTMRRSSQGLGTVTGSEMTESTIDEGSEWTGTDVDENESVSQHVVLYAEDA